MISLVKYRGERQIVEREYATGLLLKDGRYIRRNDEHLEIPSDPSLNRPTVYTRTNDTWHVQPRSDGTYEVCDSVGEPLMQGIREYSLALVIAEQGEEWTRTEGIAGKQSHMKALGNNVLP